MIPGVSPTLDQEEITNKVLNFNKKIISSPLSKAIEEEEECEEDEEESENQSCVELNN